MKNELQEKLFEQVVTTLTEQELILKKGTIMDSTIISAPSSSKNKEKKRNPDAYQIKKATPANVHDVSQNSSLLLSEEDVVYGERLSRRWKSQGCNASKQIQSQNQPTSILVKETE